MEEQGRCGLESHSKHIFRDPFKSSENTLQFICGFPGEIRHSGDGQETFVVKLPAQCNVHQLRLRLCMLAQERYQLPDPLGLLDPEKYQLLYTKMGDLYEIYDDCQVLQTLNVPWFLDPHGVKMAQISITEKKIDTDDTQNYHHTLAKLIGYDLNSTAGSRLSELSFTRRKLASPRREELKNRDPKAYATEPWTTTAPLPKDLQDWLERKLPVTIFINDKSICMNINTGITPDHLLKTLQESIFEMDSSINGSSFDPVLKVCGREEFLVGSIPLYNFLWVRSCLKRATGLHLAIVDFASLPEDKVKGEAYPLVDNLTSLSNFHEDLALSGKETDEILMISLWDCERKFRVKLLGFDIPELPAKVPQFICVEASIIYGNKVVSSVCSTAKAFTDEVLWNTWLEFDILLKNIPRGSKLGFAINVFDNTAKESKSPTSGGREPDFQRCKGNVLYFVNLQLIDHRSVLSQGPHTLHMWPFPEREEEAFTFEADKLSTATNPDVTTSMAITFLLDRYSFPVVIPHSRGIPSTVSPPSVSSPSSNSSLPPSLPASNPTSPSKSDVPGNESPILPPSIQSHRDRLRRFREESIRYTSNLPHFLRSIDWLNPDAVQDIHWLLGHWEPHDLELPVALELLSVAFADERVRSLAVQRLELLSNEEVLRYLLQLVQVSCEYSTR